MTVHAQDTAILLAAFGAARPQALKSVSNILGRVQAAFPGREVRLSFSSRFMQRLWRRRRQDPDWTREHPDVPPEILGVRSPLTALAELREEGFRRIVVQSLHIYAGEEYDTLKATVQALSNIHTHKAKHQPFPHLALGRPALGEPGDSHPYQEDFRRAARALAPEVKAASERGAALVYMGHGNEYYPSGVYLEFQETLRRAYPKAQIIVGLMEGFPDLEQVKKELARLEVRRALLVPLLLVAGQHAAEDIGGAGNDSCKCVLEQQGIQVECLLRGLGELDAWADIYVENIRELLSEAPAASL